MTENKMPAVIYASTDGLLKSIGDWVDPLICSDPIGEKYLRAEPVKALLKQARDALVRSNQGHTTINDKLNTNDTITEINKFLGEQQ